MEGGESNRMLTVDNYDLYSRYDCLQTAGTPPESRYSHSATLMTTRRMVFTSGLYSHLWR